jgi:hypothetical protein
MSQNDNRNAPIPSTLSHNHTTVNEFMFATNCESALGMMHDMGPTTMEQLFPDLLAGMTIVRKKGQSDT